MTIKGVAFGLSPQKTGEGVNRNENDSDAGLDFTTISSPCLVGKPHIALRTGDVGETNYSLDFGLIGPKLTVASIETLDEACLGAQDGSIKINASINRGILEYSIDSGSTFVLNPLFTQLSPKKYGVRIRLQGGAAGLCGETAFLVEIKEGKN
ncbi:MAG: hypothetical protein HC817_02335 [Saprospiraceae bacterium]|nr:hypothetical protein [Saprospiraceae bacterium]